MMARASCRWRTPARTRTGHSSSSPSPRRPTSTGGIRSSGGSPPAWMSCARSASVTRCAMRARATGSTRSRSGRARARSEERPMVGRARLTLDDLATRPEPGMDAPGAAKFAPDGRSITYLFSANGSLVRSLWSQDLVSGTRSVIASPSPETTREETLSREDHLLRERTRTTELGVTSYSWASAALEPTLLVPISGRLFVAVGDEPAQALHPIAGVEHASGALLRPDGSLVSYSADGELYVAPIRGGSPRRLTGDAEAGVSSGLADFIAAEELDRFEGAC